MTRLTLRQWASVTGCFLISVCAPASLLIWFSENAL